MNQNMSMPRGLTRRRALALGGALAASASPTIRAIAAVADGEHESHGLSVFGDLALPADFKALPYVNTQAPKGGTISLQTSTAGFNQNFNTFDTLNIYILRGNGAAGMGAIFDTLMAGTLDEPDAAYGLVARAVRWSADKLTYRFQLRPEARFHDGSKLTAKDAAFSLNLLKSKGHPLIQQILRHLDAAEAEGDDVLMVRLNPARSRELHLVVAGQPIFSQAYYRAHSFDEPTLQPPLGSSAYKVGPFEQGRHISYTRVADYWAKDLPINLGQNNFDTIRFEYFRDRQVAFEAFKSGVFTFREESTSVIWARGYDFPAFKDGRVKRETLKRDGPSQIQAWYFNLRRPQFGDPRIRQAISLAFDFKWTNQNIMFGLFERTWSYFQNTAMAASGKPDGEELALLEPFRDKLPPSVFTEEAYLPPEGDGSGQDRTLLGQAYKLLQAAGCKRQGTQMMLPDGNPLRVEFLDFDTIMEPRISPFIKNLKLLGIDASLRVVDTAQYQSRLQNFDYDIMGINRGGSYTPGEELRASYSSQTAKIPGSQNFIGLSDPVVDALIDKALVADTRDKLTTVCRALDRVLRVGQYWVPMWHVPAFWLAYWDMYARPATSPKLDAGAAATWWVDPDKAKRLNLPG